MATLLQRAIGRGSADKQKRYALNDYGVDFDTWMSFGGMGYPLFGASGGYDASESAENSFVGYIRSIYKKTGVISAAIAARMTLFSDVRFQWQSIDQGRPGKLFGSQSLGILESPWPNASTGEMLARAEQDVSLGGNFFCAREPTRLRRRRPDWMQIVLSAPPAEASESDVVGYAYYPGGIGSGREPKLYTIDEMIHWSPLPDPDAEYRGMSWITPVLEEIESDKAATRHKRKFFDNAATPNLAVMLKDMLTKEQFRDWKSRFENSAAGADNAYKTLYLTGGADVKPLSMSFQQLEFKVTQGAGETRISAASRVPAIVIGLSEGLQSATYSNFSQARRMFGDGWARPQWRSFCAAAQHVVQSPPSSVPGTFRLWYDDRDVAFLREDKEQAALIASKEAITIKALVDSGYNPDSVVQAMMSGDWTQLVHSGMYSVQLQSPGSGSDVANPDASAPPQTEAEKARAITEMIQKAYLGVGVLITADEVRQLLNDAGANLPMNFSSGDAPMAVSGE